MDPSRGRGQLSRFPFGQQGFTFAPTRPSRPEAGGQSVHANQPISQGAPVRRIIDRPRLLEQLEATDARTILLTAPAGYGKTTLARQWTEHSNGTYLGLSPAFRDIPFLARSIAGAIGDISGGDRAPIERAIRAARTPEAQAVLAAEAILGILKRNPRRWLIIDDYQWLAGEVQANTLVGELERDGGCRIVVASRTRPPWATERRLLYGEILELSARELALTDDEAAAVMGQGLRDVALLQRTAKGWPAVIGLAAQADARTARSAPADIEASLYEFFAEELVAGVSDHATICLYAVALLSPIEPDELGELLGLVGTPGTTDEALMTGLIHQSAGHLEVHPVARSFLMRRLSRDGTRDDLVGRCLSYALSSSSWDTAYTLISEFGLTEHFEDLVVSAFPSLVESGRITTLELFGRYGRECGGVSHGVLDLITAELALRDGMFDEAHGLSLSATTALASRHPLKAHAYFIAGSAAQFNSDLTTAYSLHTRAMRTATRPQDRNDAAWGRCLAGLFLEDDRLRNAVQELARVTDPRAEDRLRLLIARQHLARLADGLYDMRADARAAESLLSVVADPWVQTGWGNTYGYTLLLQSRYGEARRVLNEALATVQRYKLAFARPHLEWSLAAAELGLRQFARADALLRRVEANVLESRDPHLDLNVRVLRARHHLSQRRPDDALALVEPDFLTYPTRTMHGEYLATRALALAALGSRERALDAAMEGGALTGSVETIVLCAAVRVLCGVDPAERLIVTASAVDTWDGVVCALRTAPTLAEELARIPRAALVLENLLRRSNDFTLARLAGLSLRRTGRYKGLLTHRVNRSGFHAGCLV